MPLHEWILPAGVHLTPTLPLGQQPQIIFAAREDRRAESL
jgi:hypothetical protein